MSKIIYSDEDGFKKKLETYILKDRSIEEDIYEKVKQIIDNVKRTGDKALSDYTMKYDQFDLKITDIKVSQEEISNAVKDCDSDLIFALKKAAKRIRDFHDLQTPNNFNHKDKEGVVLGVKWNPLDSVGLYVPGGKASYPSSVLMTAIPAVVAGVSEISMCVPAPKGYLNSSILTAAEIAGVKNIYKIGGAQAIAAMAFGTDTIKPVNKIFGPGNLWVAEAKRQVFGKTGIDMLAGPSEIMVIADDKNNPIWIAFDLLSQAEHDFAAQSILLTDNAEFAKNVENEINKILKTIPRAKISTKSWNNNGLIIVLDDLKKSVDIVNLFAPEHIELAVDNPEELSEGIKNAGAIFLGRYSPEAIGDYVAGPNHVLPTSRTARFSSGLSTIDYMKKTSLIKCDEKSLINIAPSAIAIADSEGLHAHSMSMSLRTKFLKNEK